MEIVEFKSEFCEQVKDLLVELQEYVVKIDKYKLNILSKDYREKYYEKTLEEVYSNQGKIFLAVESGNVVGLIAGYIESYTQADKLDFICPKRGIIRELIVSEKSRAGGVGKALVNKIEDYFKTLSCEYILLDVFAYNENAKKFYSKNGYEERMVTLIKKIENNIKVVSASEDDRYLENCLRLIHNEWGEGKNFEKMLEKMKNDVSKECFAVLVDDEFVGTFVIRENDIKGRSDLNPNLACVCVDPIFRGKGYGKIILEQSLVAMKERNIKKAYLKTTLKNFYEKVGWKFLESHESEEGDEKILYIELD